MGAVVCTAFLVVTASCTDTVSLDAPRVTGADARACRQLVTHLPDRVADQPRREVDTGAGVGAAWGDPAIELRCGVGAPDGFDELSTCQVTNGVGWFIPESQTEGRRVDIVMTTVGRAQNVEVRIPSDYFPPANAMVDLAPALKSTVRQVRPCL